MLVTNNDLDIKTANRLVEQGHLPGDPDFESHGIFWSATRPRCEAAITGVTPTGDPVPGRYADSRRPHADGFEENVEFFELRYLDKDAVRRGSQFQAIEPSLWLSAGAVGKRPVSDPTLDWVLPAESNYGVLFKRASFAAFRKALLERPDITHVFLVTDSEIAYQQMRARLPKPNGPGGPIKASMLYRDYLRNFRINTQEAFR